MVLISYNTMVLVTLMNPYIAPGSMRSNKIPNSTKRGVITLLVTLESIWKLSLAMVMGVVLSVRDVSVPILIEVSVNTVVSVGEVRISELVVISSVMVLFSVFVLVFNIVAVTVAVVVITGDKEHQPIVITLYFLTVVKLIAKACMK